MEVIERSFWVFLGSIENPFASVQGSRSVQNEEKNKNIERVYYKVKDLKEASEICQKYISYFNLGSRNWIGGLVIDDNNYVVARISYNGRVWKETI
jgi:hypothetical protein